MTYRKTLQVVTSVGTHSVQLNGVGENERLTPKLARQALRVACGNDLGGLVSDGTTAYRVYAKSVRKLHIEQERTMDGSELYTLFANDAEMADVAKLEIDDITKQIGEFRDDDCNIPMSTWEIAVAIREFAREHVAEFGE